jgi:hypothetical protein
MDYKQLFDKLCEHDWSFQYSDDHRVWTKGYRALEELQGAMKTSNRMDVEVATFNFWNKRLAPIQEEVITSFGGGIGFYEWLRAYLPSGHEWHKE